MKKLLCMLLISALGVCCISCNNESNTVKTTVDELDINRYMGSWYEIARYDHSFEKDLIGCKANYTLNSDGTIKVLNTGYKKTFDGKYKETEGKARRLDDSQPGKLEVAFFASFYADYYVFELDSNYTYALVGSEKDKFLWILSRTPQMNPEDLEFVKSRITQRGYSLEELIWVEQKD